MHNNDRAVTSPPRWRLWLALFLAPLLPTLLFAEWAWWGSQSEATLFDRFMLVSLLGVYPIVILCGIPALLVLGNRKRPTLLTAALAGGILASLPWWIFALISIRDAWGMILQTAFPAFVCGMLGGAVYFVLGFAGSQSGHADRNVALNDTDDN